MWCFCVILCILCSRFDTIPACVRHAQTHSHGIYRAEHSSRGKKYGKILCFCDCLTDWLTDVWAHDFIDAPLIPDDVKDGLSDNKDLSNKLAELHDLLLPWALDQQHPSAQSKLNTKVRFAVLLDCFLVSFLLFVCYLFKICILCSCHYFLSNFNLVRAVLLFTTVPYFDLLYDSQFCRML